MNTYMIYSRSMEASEGACLVFAHTAREARKVGWGSVLSMFDTEFTDVAVQRMRGVDWLFDEADKEKISKDEPHVIDNPRSCKDCMMWGQSPIGKDGLCDDCRRYQEEDSIAKQIRSIS